MNREKETRLRARFQKEIDKTAEKYLASIPFDSRLYHHDINGSIAHAQMLAKQGIISGQDAEAIVSGLTSIRDDVEQGKFKFSTEFEDIHMNIESRLFEKIGDIAGKLHTARSRNDQIALDMRLFLKEAILETTDKLRDLQRVIIDVAEANKDIVMPGYTHLQQAQPVLLAYHLLAYFEMLQRDVERLQDCLKRVDVLPLGSGALAGVTYPIDREFVAQKLGFKSVSNNGLDTVSDRDFVIEYEAIVAITVMHLSRLAEEIILWSSKEFGFIELDDAYAASSSIMPQKKNPDVAELVRGKTGRIYGNLISMLTIMKALPLAYNRDMQEDKEGLFDTVDTILSSLEVLAGLVKTMRINSVRMKNAMSGSYILATDLADYLAKKGLPFRQTHSIVGKLVQHAIGKGKELTELTLAEYQKFSPFFADDIYNITFESAVASRNTIGGTAPSQVKKALSDARRVVGVKNAS